MASNIGTAISAWSTTAVSNQPDSTDLSSTLREDLQAIQAGVRYLRTSGTIASGGTTDLATKSEEILSVSGTTTITALGTVSAGMIKYLVFEGSLTFTHNGTSLILPGAANITTAAGDTACMLSLGSGNWRCLAYQRASGYAPRSMWELVSSTALSTGTTTITGLSATAFTRYQLVLRGFTVAADTGINIRSGVGSVDTGTNYSYVAQWYNTFDGASNISAAAGATSASVGIVGDGATHDMLIDFFVQASALRYSAKNLLFDGTTYQLFSTGGIYVTASSPVDRIAIYLAGSTFSGGTAYLYGLRV